MKNLILLSLVLLVVSCAGVPVNNQIKATADIILQAGVRIDHAEKADWISNETEDALIDDLIQAITDLDAIETLLDTCESPCAQAEVGLEEINLLLAEIEERLRESEK